MAEAGIEYSKSQYLQLKTILNSLDAQASSWLETTDQDLEAKKKDTK